MAKNERLNEEAAMNNNLNSNTYKRANEYKQGKNNNKKQ